MGVVLFSGFIIAALLVASSYAEIQEAREWEKFKTEMDCIISGTVKNKAVTGVTSAGNLVITTPIKQRIWTCRKDNSTHIR